MSRQGLSTTKSTGECQWPELMAAMHGATITACVGVPPARQAFEFEGIEYQLCDECYVDACEREEAAHA